MTARLDEYTKKVNARLRELMGAYTEKNAPNQLVCAEAMSYSLDAGGKRLRPVLALELCRIFCGNDKLALDSACALEMIHTFSLIHDDLPCMDDDDYRRGKPSCHKAYGEAVALLAGDALENYAFEIIASDEGISFEQRVKLIKELSRAVGVMGMIGGQIIDLHNEGKGFDGKTLLEMYSMKTGALIKCACRMGCICSGHEEMIPKADEYAEALGLAFQIVDDILDITADESVLGKPVHSDMETGKATYPAVFGLDAAREKAAILTDTATAAARQLGDSDFLVKLTEFLLIRTY